MGHSEKKLYLTNEDKYQSLHQHDLLDIESACLGKSKREKGSQKQEAHQ